jgi:hypothetical protein
MKLLYRISEWHAFAKLRMHTEDSLALMEECTKELGKLLRQFRQLTCTEFRTVELPREAEARLRRRNLGVATDIPCPNLNVTPRPQGSQPNTTVPISVPPTVLTSCDQNTSDNRVPTGKYTI